MTAMRNGVYAMLAVVVGVALVGLLPGQLSDLAAPTMETASLQGVSKEAAGNATLSGASLPRFYDINTTNADSVTSPEQAATTAAETNASESAGFAATATYDPYADVVYYGSWGVCLVVALGVYLVAKRMLG